MRTQVNANRLLLSLFFFTYNYSLIPLLLPLYIHTLNKNQFPHYQSSMIRWPAPSA